MRLLLSLLVLMAVAACSIQPRLTATNAGGARVGGAGQILLTVHQNRDAAASLRGAPAQRYQYRRNYGPTPAVERVLNRLASAHGIERVQGWPIASLDVYCEVYKIVDGTPVDEMIEKLSADPDVDIAQPMNTFRSLTSRYDDPYVDLQGSVVQLDIESAHSIATGRGILVALIDSQVDTEHPDLKGHVSVRRDLVGERVFRRPGEIHGTAIAGVIASSANNAEGIVGVAPDASIAALRACWSTTDADSAATCSSFSIAQALEAALEIDPDIINLSLAGPDDPLLGRLLDEALAAGIIVVAADPDETQSSFPASHTGVFAAHPAAPAGLVPSHAILRAPSSEVLTTTPGKEYAFFSGSSLAAAHISGVIALLLEKQPGLSHDELAKLLMDSITTSAGVISVNACRALAAITAGADCAR